MIAASFLHEAGNTEGWAWTSLAIAALGMALVTGTIGNGVLWRPIDRRVRSRVRDRFERALATYQIRCCMMVFVWPLHSQQMREVVGVGGIVALCVDDWLAGDDGDGWKRRRRKAANAARWLMDLPPQESPAGG